MYVVTETDFKKVIDDIKEKLDAGYWPKVITEANALDSKYDSVVNREALIHCAWWSGGTELPPGFMTPEEVYVLKSVGKLPWYAKVWYKSDMIYKTETG